MEGKTKPVEVVCDDSTMIAGGRTRSRDTETTETVSRRFVNPKKIDTEAYEA